MVWEGNIVRSYLGANYFNHKLFLGLLGGGGGGVGGKILGKHDYLSSYCSLTTFFLPSCFRRSTD